MKTGVAVGKDSTEDLELFLRPVCIVSIKDDEGNSCPVMWKSKVAKRITRSTLDAETLAMEEGLENGIWIGRIWEGIYGK